VITRRQLLRLSSCGLALATLPIATQASSAKSWQNTCKTWLKVLMPADEFGAGADSDPVWQSLSKLMEDEDFNAGIVAGFDALGHLVPPPHDRSLTRLMSQGTPVSQFLNAFFEIVIESYYGSKTGWTDIGVPNPPQPLGYRI